MSWLDLCVYLLWACVLHGIYTDLPAVHAQGTNNTGNVQVLVNIVAQDSSNIPVRLQALGVNSTVVGESNVVLVDPVCPNGSYAVAGTSGQCSPCSQQPPESYVISACTSGHDTVYWPCKACKPQEYEYSPCGAGDRICYPKGPPCPSLYQAGGQGCVPSPCPPGFSGQPGGCAACGAGKYKNQTGSYACQPCVPGLFSTGSAMACAECPAGSYTRMDGASTCAACEKGMYSMGSAQPCQTCPAGKYSESTGWVSCTTCLPGLYAPSAGASTCISCWGGRGVNGSRTACNACMPGTYALDGVCYMCNPGMFNPQPGATKCASCPSPAFSPVRGASACSACPAGTFGTACESCQAGKYQPQAGASTCIDCMAGTYSTMQMASSPDNCVNCDPGRYTSNMTMCEPCPEYTTSPAASLSVHDCTPLPGYYSQAGKRALACPKGYYCPQGTTTPALCPPGTVSDEGKSTCVVRSSTSMLLDWILGSAWLIVLASAVMVCVVYRLFIRKARNTPRLYRRIRAQIMR